MVSDLWTESGHKVAAARKCHTASRNKGVYQNHQWRGTDLHLARILVQCLEISYKLHKRLESVEHCPCLSVGVQLDKTLSNQIPQSAPRWRILIWSRHGFDQRFFKTRLLNLQIGLITEGCKDIAGFQHATSSRAILPTASSLTMINIGRGIPHCLQRFWMKLKWVRAMG